MLLGAALAVTPAGAAHPVCAVADGSFHVTFVVRHSDGEANWRICVAYGSSTPTFDPSTRSISGEEALSLTGIHYQAVDFGGSLGRAVCQLENEPPRPQEGFNQKNCFGNPYWVIWTAAQGGGWSSAGSGISNQMYADGDAEGLSYGQPSPASPAPKCAPPQPKPTPSSTTLPGTTPSASFGTSSLPGAASTPALGGAPPSSVPGAAIGAPTDSATLPASAAPLNTEPRRVPHQAAGSGAGVSGLLAAAVGGVPGLVAAGVGAIALLGMLILQVLLPRLRR